MNYSIKQSCILLTHPRELTTKEDLTKFSNDAYSIVESKANKRKQDFKKFLFLRRYKNKG